MSTYQYTHTDLLTLRPRALSSAPPGPRLPGGLPLWRLTPLDAKLPLMQGPDGPVQFTRGKLGQPLEGNTEYDPAHDRHLARWLHRPAQRAALEARNLATASGAVPCTVGEYNAARANLFRHLREQRQADARHQGSLALERLMVKQAQKNAEKEAAKLKKYEDSKEKRMSNLKHIEDFQLEKLENCRKRLQRLIDRSVQAEERKEADLARRRERMAVFDERIRSRVVAANAIERKHKIKAMKAWHKQDVDKKRQFEQRRRQREMENRQNAEARWRRKVEEQKKQIAKEKFLREQRKLMKESFVQQYMRMMEKEWARMEEELETRKCERLNVDRRSQQMRQIIQSVSEAYASKKSLGMLSRDEDAIDTLMDRIQQTLKEIRYDLEPYIVIAHAKGRLERQENVPLPVSSAIKYLLEQTIIEYTVKQLSDSMAQIARRVLTSIDEVRTQSIGGEARSISIKKSSFSSCRNKMSITSERTICISDFKEVTIQKFKEELSVDADKLQRTKGRPPTPMPSIATLTDLLFKEPDIEELEDETIGEFAFLEQRKLNQKITEVTNRILHMVPNRVRAMVNSRSYDRISADASTDGGTIATLPDNKPMARLCSVLLMEEGVREHELTPIVDRIVLGFMQDVRQTPSFLRQRLRLRHL